VLPPANESHVVAPAPAAVHPAPESIEPTASAAPSVPRGLGPREVCTDLQPTKVSACVRRLCDSEPRYQRYPICQRVHRKEEQQQRDTSE
jgi:hypothetical protein